jgi:Undecaprenyl-phosphate glucose phosphotransferase
MDIEPEAPIIQRELLIRQPAVTDGLMACPSVVRGNTSRLTTARPRVKLSPHIVAIIMAATDFSLVLLTAAFIFGAYYNLLRYIPSQSAHYSAAAIIAASALTWIFERCGGYRVPRLQALSWQMSRLLLAWSAVVLFLLVVGFAGKITDDYSRGWTFAWFLATPVVLLAERGVIHHAASRWWRDGRLARHIAVVGAGDEGQLFVARLLQRRDNSIVVRGIFDDRTECCPQCVPGFVQGVPVLGTTDDLLCYARREPLDQIVVALPLEAEAQLAATLDKLAVIPADLWLSVASLAARFAARGLGGFDGIPVLEVCARPLGHGGALCKWLEDKLIGALLLIFVAPLLAIIAILIKLDSRGPIFFVQERFGLNNNVIRVLKFRTMYVDKADKSGAQRTVRDDPRLTCVGRILRSLSLDELPQLINVLRGEMSLVGPRPHPIAMRAPDRPYHEAVARYAHRHRVKPGLTGWAQVNGFRGEVDTLKKASGRVECDLYYIANWSLWLDLKIMLMTLGLLIERTNAY